MGVDKIKINIGNLNREIVAPESWNDLELRTLMLFYNTLFTANEGANGLMSFTTVKLISMAQHLLGMDTGMLAQWEADCLAQSSEHGDVVFLHELRAVVHACVGGLFDIEHNDETGHTAYAPKLNLTRNPWPHFTHTQKTQLKGVQPKTTWLYAPADGLENVTIYELAFTFTLFEQYLQSKDDAVANRLIAALYRPSRSETREERDAAWFGDRRMPLRKYESTLDSRAEQVATMPTLTRRVLLFWFASCRQQIINRYPKVFSRADGGESGTNYGWGGVLLAMAGGPAGLDAIADQHHGNGLTWLSMKEDERRETEKAMKRKR
jgi:hypothetical protein